MVAAAFIVAAGAASVVPVAASSASAAPAPYCGITWGSQLKTATTTTALPELTNIRAGRHNCYDRLVFDVRGGNVTGYSVQYVTVMARPGEGQVVVPLRGGAKLSVTAHVPAYDDVGQSTYRPANRAELVNVTGYRTFRQVAWAGSFEGESTVGLGTRARLPFRVFTLPGHLVVDVAHAW
jgi:hypothetical protein